MCNAAQNNFENIAIMKNIRLLVRGLSLIFAMGLGSNVLFAQTKITVPGPVALEVERKTITKEEAAALVASGEKVMLDVYLVLKEGTWTSNDWKQFVENNDFAVNLSRLSFAFFEDDTYALGNFLQNPRDNIAICANSAFSVPSDVTNPCVASGDRNWYTRNPSWQLESGGSGTLPYPSYAYGAGFSGESMYLDETFVEQDGSDYKIKLFSIQFVLKNSSRSYPVAIVDEDYAFGLDGSTGATELNLGNSGYTITYSWPGSTGTPDWTQAPNSAFEFIPGGLFIENGPEVRTFEPSFLS